MRQDARRTYLKFGIFAVVMSMLTAFLLLAKAGWFTWLTPENAHGIVNTIMDQLVILVPGAYAVWAVIQNTRDKLIQAVKERPGVVGVAVTPELDREIPYPDVTTPEKLAAAAAAGPDVVRPTGAGPATACRIPDAASGRRR